MPKKKDFHEKILNLGSRNSFITIYFTFYNFNYIPKLVQSMNNRRKIYVKKFKVEKSEKDPIKLQIEFNYSVKFLLKRTKLGTFECPKMH